MKFRNYCLIVIGNDKKCVSDIAIVAENEPTVLYMDNMILSTFIANAEPSEIGEFLKLDNIEFLLFDLDSKSSSFNLSDMKISEQLFGLINKNNPTELTDKLNDYIIRDSTDLFLGDIIDEDEDDVGLQLVSIPISINYESLSKHEKELIINDILDEYKITGVLTEDKKQLISRLTN